MSMRLRKHPFSRRIQVKKQSSKRLVRPVLVGLGQRRARGRIRHPHVAQLAFAGAKPLADLPQRLGLPQLAQQHGDELAPAEKAVAVPLGLVPVYQPLELTAGESLLVWLMGFVPSQKFSQPKT